MKIPASLLFILLFALAIGNCYAQLGFIQSDSITTDGVRLFGGTAIENAKGIRARVNGQMIYYTALDLHGYGLASGKSYVSRQIMRAGTPHVVFLERLVHGPLSLYYYKDEDYSSFYLEKEDKQLIDLPETGTSSYREILSKALRGCAQAKEALPVTRYTRQSLAKVVGANNVCPDRPLRYTLFGVRAGLERTVLKIPTSESSSSYPNRYLKGLNLEPSPTLFLGLQLEKPIKKNLSMLTGVNFTKNNFSGTSHFTQLTPSGYEKPYKADVSVELTSLEAPLMIRYLAGSGQWKPFVQLGGSLLVHLQNNRKILVSESENTMSTPEEVVVKQFIPTIMPGYTLGTGLQHNLSLRNAFLVELRYGNSYGGREGLNMNHLQLLVGYVFR